jgi:GNAT superfamily N-acetyltransferase
MTADNLIFRHKARPADLPIIRKMVQDSGVFNEIEVDCAVELAQMNLDEGPACEFLFFFAEIEGEVVGYVCYGPIPLTFGSYDLNWITVDKSLQRQGLGRRLMEEAERTIRGEGGRRIYIETSTRPQYAPTRAFYERCGCFVGAVLDDFYSPGDGKAIYVKVL